MKKSSPDAIVARKHRERAARRTSGIANEAAIWAEPVNEKSTEDKRRVRRSLGEKRVGVPQYKLFEFIVKHFGGNVSKAARSFGMLQPLLYKVVTHGTIKKARIAMIVEECRKIDPEATEESLFIPFRIETGEPQSTKKRRVEYSGAKPIKPRIGGVVSVGTSPLSRSIARIVGNEYQKI